jgi:hypothetical protein
MQTLIPLGEMNWENTGQREKSSGVWAVLSDLGYLGKLLHGFINSQQSTRMQEVPETPILLLERSIIQALRT